MVAKRQKYHLEQEGSHFRIVADIDFCCHGKKIRKGDRGGLVEDDTNLSQEGTCWIDKDASAYGKAKVSADGYVGGSAIVCGCASVKDNAVVEGDCQVSAGAVVRGNSVLSGSVCVSGKVTIGKPMPYGIYQSPNGQMIKDVVMSYSPKTGLFHVNNYVSESNLNVVIKCSNSDNLSYCRVVSNA